MFFNTQTQLYCNILIVTYNFSVFIIFNSAYLYNLLSFLMFFFVVSSLPVFIVVSRSGYCFFKSQNNLFMDLSRRHLFANVRTKEKQAQKVRHGRQTALSLRSCIPSQIFRMTILLHHGAIFLKVPVFPLSVVHIAWSPRSPSVSDSVPSSVRSVRSQQGASSQ